MKTCTKCSILLPLSSFDKKGFERGKQRYRSECKDCKAKIDKARTSRRTPAQIFEASAKTYAWRQERIKAHLEHVHLFLSQNPCVDCGEEDILYLEFDHVRGAKKYNISTMVQRAFPLSDIDDEIAKCEVRCVKCHRRVTAERGGWAVLNSRFRNQHK